MYYIYIVLLIINFFIIMVKFSKEERAAISRDFRKTIQQHGLANAILTVIESTSEKTPVRKSVLQQQCRKKDFKRDFISACRNLALSHPTDLGKKIVDLQMEIVGE